MLIAVFALCFALLFVLTQYPPLAFDETLYHLPFVQAFARDGAIRFLPDLRFPVFPVLQEALGVPPFLLAGDTGPHVVSLAQAIITTALLMEWGGRYDSRAGWLAAAMFLGSPLIIHLGTVLYVDMALTLFVVAGFYALDSERYALAGIFFGSACSVKYLGFYFALVALLIVIARAADRRRSAALYSLACAAAALPMTTWIFLNTQNVVFPFFGTSPWALRLSYPETLTDRVMRLVRVVWDVTFARERIGSQPPVTPLLAGIVLLVIAAATRNRMARWRSSSLPDGRRLLRCLRCSRLRPELRTAAIGSCCRGGRRRRPLSGRRGLRGICPNIAPFAAVERNASTSVAASN